MFFILIDVLRPRVIHGLCNCFNLRLVTDLTGACIFIIRLSFLKNEEKLLFMSLSLLLIRVFQFTDETSSLNASAGKRVKSRIFFIRLTCLLLADFIMQNYICILMHDVRHERAPRNITDLFIDTKSIHSYNTRSSASHNFYIKPSKLQIQLKAFSRLGARIWNEIPTSLRDKSRSMFKSELHNILLKMLRTRDDYLNISQISQAIKLV